MIRLSKDHVLEDFFIDDNGVITNKEGEIQKVSYYDKRPHFNKVAVHKIQMWTKYGWRDTKTWSIHHIDEDKSNNAISNLVYMTLSEHCSVHSKGRSPWNKGDKMSEETKKKLSESLKGRTGHIKGRTWFNDGVNTYLIFPEEALPHYQKGRLICKK